MTEDEYIFIRKIEEKNLQAINRMTEMETIDNPNDIRKLHEDLIRATDIVHEAIEKRYVKSPDSIRTLEKIKMGYIEMLMELDQRMIDND